MPSRKSETKSAPFHSTHAGAGIAAHLDEKLRSIPLIPESSSVLHGWCELGRALDTMNTLLGELDWK